jgi:hypothetical protein
MTRRIGHLSMIALTLMLAAIPPAAANPRPPSEIPELETALRAATAHPGRSECGYLPAFLAQSGFRVLRDGTLPWIRENMKALEPCIIESQRTARSPDSLLHREFRACASPAGIKAMCAVLRERLVPPRELMALRGRTAAPRAEEESRAGNLMRACLGFADQLVAYHDRAAVPAIRVLAESLATLPASLSGPDIYGLDPRLVLREDVRRIEDPNAPELMECRDGLSWRLTRSTAEIVGVYRSNRTYRTVYGAAGHSASETTHELSLGPGSSWLRIHPERRQLDLVFALLEGGTSASIVHLAGSYRRVRLQIRFDGGLAGDLSADESGSVSWNDNTRIEPRILSGQNPAAARAIIGLADTAALGFVDWDGVSLERRRQAAAPPR